MERSKKNTIYKIASAALLALIAVAAVLYYIPGFSYSTDSKVDALVGDAIIRVLAAAFMVVIALSADAARFIKPDLKKAPENLIVFLPCLLVAIANFPFSALITGGARVDIPQFMWLFVVDCVAIAVFEELFFRGILQNIFLSRYSKKRYGLIISVLMTSAVFALWHLVNLLAGAGIADTLLQVAYTFLLGCMFSFMVIKSGNTVLAIATHAIFDIGGRLIPMTGSGHFQDTPFWIATIVVGAVAAVYVTFWLVHMQKALDKSNSAENATAAADNDENGQNVR